MPWIERTRSVEHVLRRTAGVGDVRARRCCCVHIRDEDTARDSTDKRRTELRCPWIDNRESIERSIAGVRYFERVSNVEVVCSSAAGRYEVGCGLGDLQVANHQRRCSGRVRDKRFVRRVGGFVGAGGRLVCENRRIGDGTQVERHRERDGYRIVRIELPIIVEDVRVGAAIPTCIHRRRDACARERKTRGRQRRSRNERRTEVCRGIQIFDQIETGERHNTVVRDRDLVVHVPQRRIGRIADRRADLLLRGVDFHKTNSRGRYVARRAVVVGDLDLDVAIGHVRRGTRVTELD